MDNNTYKPPMNDENKDRPVMIKRGKGRQSTCSIAKVVSAW